MNEKEIQNLKLRLIELKAKKKQTLNIFATAESISGGWIEQLVNWAGEIAVIEAKLANCKD